jgi:hypothetical protein
VTAREQEETLVRAWEGGGFPDRTGEWNALPSASHYSASPEDLAFAAKLVAEAEAFLGERAWDRVRAFEILLEGAAEPVGWTAGFGASLREYLERLP